MAAGRGFPFRRLVLASGNAGKLREFAALLAPRGIELVLQSQFGVQPAEETGKTFEANALLKARHAARGSGLPALADDSGIEVDALGGAPGVRSARYAGEGASDADNVNKLLEALREVPEPQRGARFRCVIALVSSADDESPLLARGSWEGHIVRAPRGGGGFGYDPVFVPTGSTITSAEMSAAAKNAVSHRGQALARLLESL